jgi:hypothetical protein
MLCLGAVFLEDVRIINMVLDWVGDGIVPGHIIGLEVRFVIPPQALILRLVPDLLSHHQLLHLLPFAVDVFSFDLPSPIFV